MPFVRNEPRMTTVVRGRGPVAERTIVKLKYSQSFRSDGTTFGNIFNLNSIHDPDRTGVGHQPYGHDTYSALYNRYRVFRVKAIIDYACNSGVGTNQAISCIVLPNNVGTALSNPNLMREKPNAFSRNIASNGSSCTRFRLNYNLPAICGTSHKTYSSDDRYQATFGSSPAETICLHVMAADSTDAAVAASGLFVHVLLIFYCEVFDALDLNQS